MIDDVEEAMLCRGLPHQGRKLLTALESLSFCQINDSEVGIVH